MLEKSKTVWSHPFSINKVGQYYTAYMENQWRLNINSIRNFELSEYLATAWVSINPNNRTRNDFSFTIEPKNHNVQVMEPVTSILAVTKR